MNLIRNIQTTLDINGTVERAVVTYTDGLTETITDRSRIIALNEQLKAQQQARQFLAE